MAKNGDSAERGSDAPKQLSENELRLLFENMISPFSYYRMIYDAEGRPVDYVFLAVNKAFEVETGMRREDVVGRNALSVYPQTERYWIECFGRVAKTGEPEHLSAYSSALQKWYSARAYSPQPDHVALTISDITQYIAEHEKLSKTTQELKAQKDENYRLAHVEPITGLPNRACLYDAFAAQIQGEGRSRKFSLAIFTPDNLAEILASYGSVLSDQIMRAIAQRVNTFCTTPDAAFSMTGTDLAVLLVTPRNARQAQTALAQISGLIRQPVEIDGTGFVISATCGVAWHPEDGTNADDLIMKANLALYDAKKNGIPISIFNKRISRGVFRRMQVRNALPKALENREFELVFQPQIQAYPFKILGFEALLRWHSAELGEILPLEFIGVAEESRLILPLGAWVLRSACNALRQINELYHAEYFIAVNVSGVQLHTSGFLEQVLDELMEAGLPPGQLELEVTESVLLNRKSDTLETLNALYHQGVRIALDDFGTGYSSLSLLKDFEISTLKIDKTFIQDPNAMTLTELMVRMGHILNADVVAEGVETEDQMQFVKRIGCDRQQGFFYAKPMPITELKSYIQKMNRR